MMKKKRPTGLGRGISALIPDFENPETQPDFLLCPVAEIAPNRYQPRTVFNPEELDRLRMSIEQQGILQPLLVRQVNDSYELIAGERRLRAAKEARLSHVPVFVKDLTDEQVLEVSIIENIQRQNLNVLEEAEAYHRLIQEFGYTQERVAEKIGKNRSTIANLLRLRSLPEVIKQALVAEKITMGHARALLGAGPDEDQVRLYGLVVQRELSVRETEKLVNSVKQGAERFRKVLTGPEKQFLDEASRLISKKIKARVSIRKNGETGKIEISFQTKAQLQDLIEMLSRL